MEIQIVKRVLTSCKVVDIVPILKKWSLLSVNDVEQLQKRIDFKQVKRKTAEEIAEFASTKGGLNGEKAGDLDLLCQKQYSQKKQWHVYNIEEKLENRVKRKDPIKNVTKLRQELNRLVKLHYRPQCSVSVMLYNGVLWGRAYLPRPNMKIYQPSHCVYFAYYPQTPVVIVSGLKTAFTDFLSKCLMLPLGYPDPSINSLRLSGRHVESLAKLAINKHMKGGFTAFQLSQRPSLPLSETREMKRKVEQTDFDDRRIVNINNPGKRQRLEILDDQFGTYVQPTLEKVEFDLKLHYRGKQNVPSLRQDKIVFNSHVKFTGNSVLEGIRNLGSTGLAKVPLPKHLQRIPQRAGNYFVLQDSKKTSNTTSNVTQSTTVSSSRYLP